MSLKERIEKAMERKKCDAATLAREAGIKAPSVHGWINGSSQSMRAGPAIRAAAYLQVNPLWLAEGDGEMIPYDTAGDRQIQPQIAKEPKPHHYRPLVQKVCDMAEQIDDDGLRELAGFARCLTGTHPLVKPKQKSSA
jgi:transcriptional regulator with XRE-family HTH domain